MTAQSYRKPTPSAPTSPTRTAATPATVLLLRFADTCPVYFDRHTLSLKDGQLSMLTLDGRLRFQLALSAQDEARFHTGKLSEVVLSRQADGAFAFTFQLENAQPADAEQAGQKPQARPRSAATAEIGPDSSGEIPPYVMVEPMPSIPKLQATR